MKRLRNYKYLNPLFVIRDWLWNHLGLFKLKANIKRYFFLKRLVCEDTALKEDILEKIETLPDGLLRTSKDSADCVISLTSYGKRVEDTLPYTLYSLLIQTILPKHIVVYLDRDNWSEKELPDILKTLQRKGIEFYFYEDIRSYKKLIPALQMFPNSPIITVDDDMYYNAKTVEWFMQEYIKSDKRTVMGFRGTIVQRDGEIFIPYNQWKTPINNEEAESCLIGCDGILYPPYIFDDEIYREEIFMELCPTADDLWFWAMEKRLGISIKIIQQYGYHIHRSVNRIEEFDLTIKDTLMFSNVAGGKNDEQFYKLIEKYKLN